MIWWPLINEYSFIPALNKKIELTKGLFVKYSISGDSTLSSKYKFDVWIEKNHYMIEKIVPQDINGVLSITRKKNVITLEINGEKRPYYLKTPLIWKLK